MRRETSDDLLRLLRRLLLPLGLCIPLCLAGFVRVGTAGEVTGTVTVRTEEKASKPRRYYMGPYRSGQGRDSGPKASVKDVVLYLDGDCPKAARPSSKPEPVMVQTHETFIPTVLPIEVGTEVSFPNRDPYYHNVFSVMAGDRFDLGRYAEGETGHKVFETPGVVVVRCEIHPRMKAYLLVLETACFTVPDSTGRYAFSDLPAGQYTLKAWHPSRGEQTTAVAVPDSGSISVRFDF